MDKLAFTNKRNPKLNSLNNPITISISTSAHIPHPAHIQMCEQRPHCLFTLMDPYLAEQDIKELNHLNSIYTNSGEVMHNHSKNKWGQGENSCSMSSSVFANRAAMQRASLFQRFWRKTHSSPARWYDNAFRTTAELPVTLIISTSCF